MATFTDFKNDFYSRVNDVHLFDCGDVNLIKVVLDGLKVDYVSKGKVRSLIFFPFFIFYFFIKIKKTLKFKEENEDYLIQKINKGIGKKHLISDMGRIVYNSKKEPKSLYFDNIIKTYSRENVFIVMDKVLDDKLDFDICINDIVEIVQYKTLSKSDKFFRDNLLKTFLNIKKSKKFDKKELENIKYAFHKFFTEYKAWNYLVKKLGNIQTCLFICHYHKEGQILALKNSKIKCIELQHGLIASQDIFYLFPKLVSEIRDKALFADRLLVYGNFWKNKLLNGSEYLNNQIDIIGYYLYNDFSEIMDEELNSFTRDKMVIVITTQTFLHNQFIDFTTKLENFIIENNKNAIIILKPHPAEKLEIYTNAFSNSKLIRVLQYPLPLIFNKASVHISVYSTTLFDALRHNLKNYVFKVAGCEDYVNEIIESGIATEILEFDQLFNIKDESNLINSIDFYANFNNRFLIN